MPNTYINRRIVLGTGRVPLLLDLQPSTKPCYSVTRKLRNAYTGASITVVRDSDSSEKDIGFRNNLLDTSSLLSFVGSANGYIKTLYDQNTSVNLTNTDPLTRPKIVIAGILNQVNSLPAMNWAAATRNYLRGSSAADWAFLSNGYQYQVYMTLYLSAGTNALFGTNTIGTGVAVGYFNTYSANNITTFVTNGVASAMRNIMVENTVPVNTNFLFTELGDPSNATAANRDSIFINNGSAIKHNTQTAAVSSSNPANPLDLGGYGNLGGGGGVFVGNIQELLFY